MNNSKNSKDEIILSARQLSKSYSQGRTNYPVLHEVDLEVKRGEFLAIMGPSGSGKSTLLHILGLMARPTQAESLKIARIETVGISQGKQTIIRREKIGFVFQRFNLLGVLNAADNLKLALKLRGISIDHQVGKVLDFVGLSEKHRSKPGQMSIGEQQRLAFARAIIHKPAILLADEPTGNLDSANTAKLMDLIQLARQEFNQTIIFVTHSSELASQADRMCIMNDGKLAG